MLTPLIQNFSSPQLPFEVFKVLYGRGRKAFFFDSHSYLPPKQVYSYIGTDPFLEITVRNSQIKIQDKARYKIYPVRDLFRVLREVFEKYRMRSEASRRFFCGGAVGFWAYEAVELFERIALRNKKTAGAPLLYLGLFRDLIVYDHRRKMYKLVSLYHKKVSGFSRQTAEKRIADLKSIFARSVPNRMPTFRSGRLSAEMTQPHFETMVRRAKDYIAAGDIYQANLSQRFSFNYKGHPLKLYETLRKINPSPFALYLDTGEINIVSSSPERLVLKRGKHCETNPIAGTRPHSGGAQKGRRLEKQLKTSPKEKAEHVMLVDLERNDLGRVCDWPTVKVREMMTVEKYSHVIHLVSRVSGQLSKKKDMFDLLQAMFPGGTITGCPKVRCMEIIDELEPSGRGIYTGSIGYLGFDGDMDLNIAIRTIVLRKGKGHLQVGSGIVYDSDPKREYFETLQKAKALVKALREAGQP